MVEKMDRKPDGWVESVNSTFPRISDDDPVVFRDERNNLMRDLGEQMKDLFQQYQYLYYVNLYVLLIFDFVLNL